MMLGIGLLQTFHVAPSDDIPQKADFKFRPHAAWIVTMVEGLLVFCYGFVGFWLAERKRRIWRLNIHRI